MKTTTYKCDRCGCELGPDGAALERTRFATRQRILYQIRFGKNWKSSEWGNGDIDVIVYELCEKCRNALDKWLMMEEE